LGGIVDRGNLRSLASSDVERNHGRRSDGRRLECSEDGGGRGRFEWESIQRAQIVLIELRLRGGIQWRDRNVDFSGRRIECQIIRGRNDRGAGVELDDDGGRCRVLRNVRRAGGQWINEESQERAQGETIPS
jgi:hypothetical protein